MSAHRAPQLSVMQEKVIRWAQVLVDRGEVPTVAAVLAEARVADPHASEEAVWIARKSLIRRGLFPGGQALIRGPQPGTPAPPPPAPPPRRKRWRRRHEFAGDCLKQRQILEAMRARLMQTSEPMGDDQ